MNTTIISNNIQKEGALHIEEFIIENDNIIQTITGKDYLKKIIIHLDHKQLKATYEEDYTKFEITWKLQYPKTKKLLKNKKRRK